MNKTEIPEIEINLSDGDRDLIKKDITKTIKNLKKSKQQLANFNRQFPDVLKFMTQIRDKLKSESSIILLHARQCSSFAGYLRMAYSVTGNQIFKETENKCRAKLTEWKLINEFN
ncbi:MAG: hypothetical protein ACI9AT_000420 [Ulvibacter sp.]|jgi:hypothetical protein